MPPTHKDETITLDTFIIKESEPDITQLLTRIKDKLNSGADEEQKEQTSEHEKDRKKLENDSFEQDITERKKFAKRAYKITVSWVIFLILLTILQFISPLWSIGLSDLAFNIVFTSTTASIIGFWFLVGKYLFRQS